MSLDLFFSAVVISALVLGALYFTRFVSALRHAGASTVTDIDQALLALVEKKDHLMEDLRDLELDFRMGKISDEEYHRQRSRLAPQAVSVIRALDARGYRDPDEALFDEEEELDDELGADEEEELSADGPGGSADA